MSLYINNSQLLKFIKRNTWIIWNNCLTQWLNSILLLKPLLFWVFPHDVAVVRRYNLGLSKKFVLRLWMLFTSQNHSVTVTLTWRKHIFSKMKWLAILFQKFTFDLKTNGNDNSHVMHVNTLLDTIVWQIQ